jgi:translocation and assembly module TamB
VRGLSLANPVLAQAVGSEASFAMRGASTIKSLVDFQTLEIKSQTLSAAFKRT